MSVATSFIKYWKATKVLLDHAKGRDLEKDVSNGVLELIRCSLHLSCYTKGWNSKYKESSILCTFSDDSYLEIIVDNCYADYPIIEDIRLQSIRRNKYFCEV